jgi:hypothetical protein
MVDGARARAYLRLGGLAQDGVGEGADGVGRRRAIRRAVVLARDEVAHRHGDGRTDGRARRRRTGGAESPASAAGDEGRSSRGEGSGGGGLAGAECSFF